MSLFKRRDQREIHIASKSKQYKTHIYLEILAPNRLYDGDYAYRIKRISSKYALTGFIVQTSMIDGIEKVLSVITIGGLHPNSDVDTGVFCLPNYMKYQEFNDRYITDLRKTIKIWNLNNCHHYPTREMDYEVGDEWKMTT